MTYPVLNIEYASRLVFCRLEAWKAVRLLKCPQSIGHQKGTHSFTRVPCAAPESRAARKNINESAVISLPLDPGVPRIDAAGEASASCLL